VERKLFNITLRTFGRKAGPDENVAEEHKKRVTFAYSERLLLPRQLLTGHVGSVSYESTALFLSSLKDCYIYSDSLRLPNSSPIPPTPPERPHESLRVYGDNCLIPSK